MSLATPIIAEEPAGRPRPEAAAGCVPAPASGSTATTRILAGGTFDGRVTHVERIPGRPGRAVPGPARSRPSSGWDSPIAESARPGLTRRQRRITPGRPQRDHLHAGRVRQVTRLPHARADLGAQGRDRALPHADQGPGRRPAPRDPLAAAARGAGRGPGRGHPSRRPQLGQGTCLLPGDDAGHAAPRAAARARPLGPVPVQAAVRHRGRVPRLPGRVRLARGPGAARLRRIAAYYAEGRAVRERARRGRRDGPLAAGPVFILASATVAEPARCAALLTGLGAEEVDADASPRGPVTFALWEPPLTALRGEAGARLRRTATAEASRLLSIWSRRT